MTEEATNPEDQLEQARALIEAIEIMAEARRHGSTFDDLTLQHLAAMARQQLDSVTLEAPQCPAGAGHSG